MNPHVAEERNRLKTSCPRKEVDTDDDDDEDDVEEEEEKEKEDDEEEEEEDKGIKSDETAAENRRKLLRRTNTWLASDEIRLSRLSRNSGILKPRVHNFIFSPIIQADSLRDSSSSSSRIKSYIINFPIGELKKKKQKTKNTKALKLRVWFIIIIIYNYFIDFFCTQQNVLSMKFRN